MKERYVLDANALIDFLESGPGMRKVDQLLQAAARDHADLAVSVMNLGEVFYYSMVKRGEEQARKAVQGLTESPIGVVPVELPCALRAGELKARHKIPYVDCIAAALAIERQATLVTADRHFEKLGRSFPVLWLPRR